VITAEFFVSRTGLYVGFRISGHAFCGLGKFGADIVCAGVSSAVMLAANTITDFFEADADVRLSENTVELRMKSVSDGSAKNGADGNTTAQASKIMHALKVHLGYLGEQVGSRKNPNGRNAGNTGICVKKIIEE
jgi:uncharacterized protein YsxB (DUF464 family)